MKLHHRPRPAAQRHQAPSQPWPQGRGAVNDQFLHAQEKHDLNISLVPAAPGTGGYCARVGLR